MVAPIQQAWRSFWTLQKRRNEPAWARLLIAGAIALVGALVLMLLAGILTGSVSDANWWRWWPKYLFLICLTIAYAILALCRGMELLLPEAVMHQLSPARDWRAALFLNFVVVAGTLGGYFIALQLIGWLFGYPAWMKASFPLAVTRFLAFVALLVAANWAGGMMRRKQRLLQYQVMESRLRMLQAQIEPHFLFNTLANVQSLIEYDPARAKRMLGGFTDHLRASLDQLRDGESTLEMELSTARNYLELLQIRMQERLQFTIDATREARAATMPTLLLQPLIENAIQHGLEPKIEGGKVGVRASVEHGRLIIHIDDDGMGLDAPRRSRRSSNGLALANIDARLRTRYGSKASLALSPRDVGTRASLILPLA